MHTFYQKIQIIVFIIIVLWGCATTPPAPFEDFSGKRNTDVDECYSLVQAGKYFEALLVCEGAVANSPENFIAHASYAKALAETDRIEEALFHYAEALEIDPSVLNARMEYAAILKDTHNYADALTQLDTVLDNQSDHVPAIQEKAAIYKLQKNWQQAVEMLDQAILYRSDDQALRVDLVQALAKIGRQSEIVGAIMKASSDFPDSVSLAFAFASQLQELRMYKHAVTQYNRLLTLDGNNHSARYNLALCHYQDKNLREAEKAVMHLLQGRSASSSAYVLAGQIALDRGNTPGAETHFRKAIEVDASNGSAWVLLGNVLRKNGDRPGAAEAYRQALRIDPSNETAKRNLKRVY